MVAALMQVYINVETCTDNSEKSITAVPNDIQSNRLFQRCLRHESLIEESIINIGFDLILRLAVFNFGCHTDDVKL